MPLRLCSSTIALLALFGSIPASAVCHAGPFPIALPEQRLDERLQDLAHRTGCFVAVEPALLEGQRARAIKGSLTAEQAFIQSVRGTGLEATPAQGHWHLDRAEQSRLADRIATLRGELRRPKRDKPITRTAAQQLVEELDVIAAAVPRLVREQGFLSAAERAAYDQRLDAIERALRS